MALIQKTNPVGLDREIDDFQVYLYAKLGFNDWKCYPRVYSMGEGNNNKNKGVIPVHFDSGVDYEDVCTNNDLAVSSFFMAADEEITDNELRNETIVALIFQVNLNKLFPSINHRADEEFNRLVRKASDAYVGHQEFKRRQKISNNIPKVYKEFVTEKLTIVDNQPNYVVRFEYDVRYSDYGC